MKTAIFLVLISVCYGYSQTVYQLHFNPQKTEYKLATYIALQFSPTYPKCFSGDYMDVIKAMFFSEYLLNEANYYCLVENVRVNTNKEVYKYRYVEVRIIDDKGIKHDYTFEEFKKLMYGK